MPDYNVHYNVPLFASEISKNKALLRESLTFVRRAFLNAKITGLKIMFKPASMQT